jgi:hypothetical protein
MHRSVRSMALLAAGLAAVAGALACAQLAHAAVPKDIQVPAGNSQFQRLATSGGLAPAPSACSAGTAGKTAEGPCTADYTFWKASER